MDFSVSHFFWGQQPLCIMKIKKQFIPLDISPVEEKIIGLIADCAKQLEMNAYLVGGYVRDKILQRDSKDIKDIDVTVAGSGIQLAELVASRLQPSPSLAVSVPGPDFTF